MKTKKVTIPASLLKRILAYLIDILLINIFVVLPFSSIIKSYESTTSFSRFFSSLNTQIFLVYLTIAILSLLYFIILEYILRQTLGKIILKIKVASKQKHISLKQIILRNIPKPFILLLIADTAYMLIKKTNERYTEQKSKTFVVEEVTL